ncbi:trafficking particle complex subunit 8 isoform X2 [Brachionus plicatilis]|uniref:Trafficking particle complex subunit 8 isoform X2 n=1 Tax=Brachionus plicatilis TaxID=10195 RepID=A0A3M7SLA7_BRAPC|nr:trafficking particle complex subunit 8 isoform X2 [Brachionus plicatilis]
MASMALVPYRISPNFVIAPRVVVTSLRYLKKNYFMDMHSVLAYKNALQVYSNKAWTRILDQINFSLSCQSQKLSNIDQALQYLEDILFKKKSVNMLTCAAMSRENKLSTRHNSSNESYILQHNADLILRLPTIDIASLKINMNPIENFCLDSNKICINSQESLEFFENSSYNFNDLKEIWKKLEEAVCISNFGTIPSVFFKPQSSIYNSSVVYNSVPTAVCDEFIEISFNLVNTLKVDLILKDCILLWKFNKQNLNEKEKNSQISSDQEKSQILDCAEAKSIDQILIPCKSEKLIRLLIKPREQNGNLCILGIKYKLASDNGSIKLGEQLEGKQLFEFKEKRNNNIKKNMRPKAISVQNSLNFKIVKKMPLLQVNVDNLPQRMFCNQIHKINICLMNLSEDTSIGNIKISIHKSSKSNALFKNSNLRASNDFGVKFENVDKEIIQNLSSITIKPKQEVMLDLWIQTNDVCEKNFFNFLIAYQESNEESMVSLPTSKYRTIRFRLMIENVSMIYENQIRMMNPLHDSCFIGNIEINCRRPLDEMSICNIFSITETVNSNTTDNKKFESLHLNLFNNDTSSHQNLNNVNDIIENFSENRYKYICENNCLVLYFLIMIRKKEEKFFILKDVEFSIKTINKPLIPDQDFNKRIHMNATQHEKLISYCSKITRYETLTQQALNNLFDIFVKI